MRCRLVDGAFRDFFFLRATGKKKSKYLSGQPAVPFLFFLVSFSKRVGKVTRSTRPSLSGPSKLPVKFARSLAHKDTQRHTQTHEQLADKKKQRPDGDYRINNSQPCLQSITVFTLSETAILPLSVPCLRSCPACLL